MPDNFWVVFIANLPLLAILFWALQSRWIVMGITYKSEVDSKDKEIEFREKLRQEAVTDVKLLQERDKEKTEALRELTNVVKQTLDLNENLLDESLDRRWDGNERRRSTRPSSRTR